METFDVAIIGGGIVGLATAKALATKHPECSIALIEKEECVATHQTGRNSGVIHSGIYYPPGSSKATHCIQGRKELLAFCQEHSVPVKQMSKYIVASKKSELPRLHALLERGKANGLSHICKISSDELKEREPHINGLGALRNDDCYIVSFKEVAQTLLNTLQLHTFFNSPVHALYHVDNRWIIETKNHVLAAKKLVNAAGLYSDTIYKSVSSKKREQKIIPFRGEYYTFREEAEKKVSSLIYPVPDPSLPFLGVHITPMMNGGVEAGPNAVLAGAREGYSKMQIAPQELLETLSFPGFWKIAQKYFSVGAYEMYRSFSKKAFLQSVQTLMPSLTADDIVPGGSGVRAQLVGKDGTLVQDFALVHEKNALHILNAPSPAATASFSIGKHVANILFNDE